MTRFTSEFGMGSGGSTSLWPPSEKDGEGLCMFIAYIAVALSHITVWVLYGQASRVISTG